MTARVAIIDYGMGNLRSVANALATLPCSVEMSAEPRALASATHIVLPGVGAFGDGIRNLHAGGWISALEIEVLERGKPFLGICLGMQLLALTGTEHGHWNGLGWIPGTVTRLRVTEPALRIPHMGWNDVTVSARSRLLGGLPGGACFYFVHSFVFVPDDESSIAGFCTYGESFVAAIEHRNIFGVQFHPEKSQRVGLSVLSNFIKAGVEGAS